MLVGSRGTEEAGGCPACNKGISVGVLIIVTSLFHSYREERGACRLRLDSSRKTSGIIKIERRHHPRKPIVPVHISQQAMKPERAVRVVRVADDLLEDVVQEVRLACFSAAGAIGLADRFGRAGGMPSSNHERGADQQEQHEQAEGHEQEDAAAAGVGSGPSNSGRSRAVGSE